MSGYGLFQPSTLGMQSQSHKLNTIGYNIANVNTGGFKRTDTLFQTVLSDTIDTQSDYGGVKPFSRATNDVQGLIQTTGRKLDVAISGDGFFGVQPDFSSSTSMFYTRDGSFQINTVEGQTSSITADDGTTLTVSNGYLVDKNGYFLQGVPVNSDGTFSVGSAAPMRVDQYAFTELGKPTTSVSLEFNLASNQNVGDDPFTYGLRTFDSNANERNISFDFMRQVDNNQWRLNSRADNLTSATLTPSSAFSVSAAGVAQGTAMNFNSTNKTISLNTLATSVPIADSFNKLAKGDSITITGTASNNGTYTVDSIDDIGSTITVTQALTDETGDAALSATNALPDPLIFSSKGTIQTPTEITYSATWDDGSTSSFTIDLSNMTQFGDDFSVIRTSQDGLGKSDIIEVTFDDKGQVIGNFADGTSRALYKVPLYDFANPNALNSRSGMLFTETTGSGAASSFFADESSKAGLSPGAAEISNVDIAQEFSQMIQAQTAYNMSATTFKTIDEMTTVARDLKA